MTNKILHYDVKRKDDWFYLCRPDYMAIHADKIAVHVSDVTCKNCLRILRKLKEDLDPRR